MEKKKKTVKKKVTKTISKKKPISKAKKTIKKKKIKKVSKRRYKNVGRKKFDGRAEDVVNKLEYAFAMGCTDVEACIYAGTNRTSLTNYQNDNPSFLDKKEQLKKTPVLKARLKIISSINKSVNTARWYLEHKEKDEFSTKQETEHTGNINTTVIHTKEDALKEIEELKKELKDGKKD